MKKPVRYGAGFFVTSTCLTKRETSAVIQRQSFDARSTRPHPMFHGKGRRIFEVNACDRTWDNMPVHMVRA